MIARSEGEAQRFEKLLTEYSLAKEVTRDRLYIDAMEKVFKNSSKVMIDVKGGNNMMYLPLDKLGQSNTSVGNSTDVQALRRDLEQLRRDLSTGPCSNRGATAPDHGAAPARLLSYRLRYSTVPVYQEADTSCCFRLSRRSSLCWNS